MHAILERVVPSDPGGTLVIRNRTSGSVVITNDLTIGPASDIALPAGQTLRLEKLRFGKLTLNAGSVELERCAVGEFVFASADRPRVLNARSVLFGSMTGGQGNATLEYCTILDHMRRRRRSKRAR